MAAQIVHTTQATGTYTHDGELTKNAWNEAHTLTGVIDVANGGTGVATLTGLAKGNGTSAFTAAVAGTDYAPATSGTALLKGNGAGGFSSAASGTDYLAPAAIGSTVQSWDADLDAIAALAGTSGFLKKTAANTWSLDTSTYLTTASAASTYQPLDAELSAIAGLTSAADKVPYFTGSGTAALADLTTAGRTLIGGASASAQRTSLGVGTGDSPQFAALEIGAATDTTLSRVRAGQLAVEGKNIPYIFAQSGTAASVGAVITETTLATISFAGGEIGPNGWIQVFTTWTVNNNANAKNCRIRVGGAAGTAMSDFSAVNSVFYFKPVFIWNSGSASSQKTQTASGNGTGTGVGTSAPPTGAVNTASAWDLVITGQKAVSGDTLTLEAYQVIVCYGA